MQGSMGPRVGGSFARGLAEWMRCRGSRHGAAGGAPGTLDAGVGPLQVPLGRTVGEHEPTRGVDVGAKAEIHRLVKEMADNGTAVLIVSSDLPELLELSDVIHVMRDGRITGSLTREDATEQSVMTLAAGEAETVA